MKTFYNKNELIFEKLSLHKSFKDLTGQKFERLTVLGFAEKIPLHYWYCECTCGNIVKIFGGHLVSHKSKSCGCLAKETVRKNNLTHGYTNTPTFNVWQSLLSRCLNPNNKSYKDYGARGITVCNRWLKFENFLEDMGEKPEGLSIDRKENDKGYYKENCRWATIIEQANNKRSNTIIKFKGIEQTAVQWERKNGLHRGALGRRIAHGWTLEEALTLPMFSKRVNNT